MLILINFCKSRADRPLIAPLGMGPARITGSRKISGVRHFSGKSADTCRKWPGRRCGEGEPEIVNDSGRRLEIEIRFIY